MSYQVKTQCVCERERENERSRTDGDEIDLCFEYKLWEGKEMDGSEERM